MPVPYFFAEHIHDQNPDTILDEDTSRHIVQVLRMKEGAHLNLTNGKGLTVLAEISSAHKKHTTVRMLSSSHTSRDHSLFTIAISPIKNMSRFEWFLEKASELGTASVIPMICERTEKQHLRHERLVNICKSAMLQSAQSWMTELHEPTSYREVVDKATQQQKMIAHCMDGEKALLNDMLNTTLNSHLVLIGPEGDFTASEVSYAESLHFRPVSLGSTRLRTETAGIVAAVIHAIQK